MAARPSTTHSPTLSAAARPLALLLATAFALATASGVAVAQDEAAIGSVQISTNVGDLLITLEEDHPVIREYARAFANLVRDRVFFHRSDDRVGCSDDDPECFLCVCVPEELNCLGEPVGSCLFDPLEASCSETGFRRRRPRPSDGILAASPNILQAGRFELDENNRFVDIRDRIQELGLSDLSPQGIFENNSLTVAFIRDENDELTGEWIINLADNSDALVDPSLDAPPGTPPYDDPQRGRLVIGQVTDGGTGLFPLIGLETTDARCNETLRPTGDESCEPQVDPDSYACQIEVFALDLDQLPVVDFFRGVDTEEGEDPEKPDEPELLTVCDPTQEDDGCRRPLCATLSDNELECLDPLCYAVTPLETPIGDVTHQCDFPETPNFPLAEQSNPTGVTLVNNGLAPPTVQNVLDFANNPQLTVDIRDEGCVDTQDPPATCPNPGTPTVFEVTTTGTASLLRVSDTSRLTLDGIAVLGVETYHDARATLRSGRIGGIASANSSDLALDGRGTLAPPVESEPIETITWILDGESTGLWAGIGTASGAPIQIDGNGSSLLRIVGSSFEKDAQSVVIPATLRDESGDLTGTLASGDSFDASFDLETDAEIHLLSSSSRQLLMPQVTISAPGNAPDGESGLGSVGQVFSISQTEVTNEQYASFLSRAALSDPRGLWDESMELDPRGGITRSGANGNYQYSVPSGREQWPVVFVSRDDAMRYVNWLENDGPTTLGVSTETGVYGFDEEGVYDGNGRTAGTRWFLPTRDEWYKAAYYDPATASYFQYPTASNAEPQNVTPERDVGNAANLDVALGDNTAPLSDVGSYRFSASPNGTLDQAGNVLEWVEDETLLFGGHWNAFADRAGTAAEAPIDVTSVDAQESFLGFRVPEPAGGLLAAAAVTTLAALRRRTHR